MKNIFTLLAFVLLFGACASDSASTGAPDSIASLEAAYQADGNATNAKALLTAYESTIASNPTSASNAELLYKTSELQIKLSRYAPAANSAKQVLKMFPDSPIAAKTAALLTTIYNDKLSYGNAAKVLQASCLTANPNMDGAAALKASLGENTTPFTLITTMQNNIFDNVEKKMNFQKASEYVEAVEVSAMMLPNHAEMPTLLSKAAEIAGSNRTFKKALELYEWVYEKYPNHEKAGTALFMQAFTLDNELKQKDAAKKIYETFIAKYPKNGFAESAQFLLENLGKSDEEIISKFQE